MMLRKTPMPPRFPPVLVCASMRPQHDAAENIEPSIRVSVRVPRFNEAAA